MRLLALASCLILLTLPSWASPIYRAGQDKDSTYCWLHGEISADYQFSSQRMELVTKEDNTAALKGWGLRALWTPVSWLGIGAETTRFENESFKEFFVSSYQNNRVGGLLKATLSPDTNPRVYLLAGYGRISHKLEYDHSSIITASWPTAEKKKAGYWMLGIGLETNVWKSVFVGVEGNVFRYTSTQLKRYYQTNSKTETSIRLRAGVRF